jgi:hypothetical protein
MGLLDDAIREHLDLKRRRGADPSEVERAEREALGPVRRTREAGDEVDADLGLQSVTPPAPQPAEVGDPEWASQPDRQPDPWADDQPSTEGWEDQDDAAVRAADADVGGRWTSAPAPLHDEGWDERELDSGDDVPRLELAGEPAVQEQPQPPSRGRLFGRRRQAPEPAEQAADTASSLDAFGGGETMEFDVEDALDAEGEGEDGDVLEATPEFLQDTPEHDRLWFEQRPPRDFDFDG